MKSLIPAYTRNQLRPTRVFDDPFFADFFRQTAPHGFRVDVREQDDRFLLEAELPGMEPEQIDLSVQDHVLNISADLHTENKQEQDNYVFTERRTGHFSRRFDLDGIDEENIEAAYRHGVLTVTLPKLKPAEKPEARKITIN